MEEYKFLLDIAIILAMTKSFSLVSKKFNMPPVVGALIAGIILGPVVLNVVSPSDSVLNLAEVGVVVLMFQAGLETDIDELKKSGIPAFVIALCGVLIPLIMGAVLSVIYGNKYHGIDLYRSNPNSNFSKYHSRSITGYGTFKRKSRNSNPWGSDH